jgi:CheY-like chemotaxis protein
LNNAIKFTPSGGHIWLIAERTGEVPERPDQVRIRVRDTGIGIAPELRNRVFDMFLQGDRSLERTRGGLGVGLTLVRSLVALHGGRVDAWSEGVGRGSEFMVLLPVESVAEEAPAVDGSSQPGPGRTLRVLVADDNEDSREMLKYLLTSEGHTVVTAADGDEAYRAMSTSPPDVGILDVSMPRLNGFSLAQKLRENESMKSTFLIALSGLGQPEDKESAIAAGFDQHITKPVEMSSLLRLLAERFP